MYGLLQLKTGQTPIQILSVSSKYSTKQTLQDSDNVYYAPRTAGSELSYSLFTADEVKGELAKLVTNRLNGFIHG